ncbi:uncharacterized protein TM35_000015680 [Trypanosoma theileri]|uniref:Uncharacterized protein n=1 Tax=Trypanosoma theileri TaxID=67003 RepID=A0A1X0PA38_9TRYP|nr:uncharacterized protein TM35_000015680 [Trypanosoma theileri]ORC93691.1 hypothetical protein TM35_000015680 [Trypanosoma theileri]
MVSPQQCSVRRGRMHNAVPLPGITFAGTSYGRGVSVFAPLPPGDARRRRHRDVEDFRRAPRPPQRPRWNASILDEAHPFPQPPLMHVLQRRGSNGGEADSSDKTGPQLLTARGVDSTRRAAGSVVREREHELALERGWCISTNVSDPSARFRKTADFQVSYLELNKSKKGMLDESTYVSPMRRVALMDESIRATKRSKRKEDELMLQSQLARQGAPSVFKMSNIDEWWSLDPILKMRTLPKVKKSEEEEVEEEEEGKSPTTLIGNVQEKYDA